MQSAVSIGFSQPSEEVIKNSPVFCPGGNCTWPDFETLGVCHKRENATDLIEKSDITVEPFLFPSPVTNFSLPNGISIENADGTYFFPGADRLDKPDYWMGTLNTGEPRKTVMMEELTTLIWSTSIIAIDTERMYAASEDNPLRWPEIPIQASECALYYCVKSIKASVNNNILHERQAPATRFSMTQDSWKPIKDGRYAMELARMPHGVLVNNQLPDDLQFDPYTPRIGRSDVSFRDTAESEGVAYNVTQVSVFSLSEYLLDIWKLADGMGAETWALDDGEVTKGLRNLTRLSNGYARTNPKVPKYIVYEPEMTNLWWNNGTGFMAEKRFEALAISLTNQMRADRLSLRAETSDASDGAVFGVIQVPVTIYQTSWKWITFHSVVLIGTLLFCAGIMALPTVNRPTAALPVWKSSSLPILNCGIFVQGVSTIREMAERAKKRKVMIRPMVNASDTGGDGELVHARRSSSSDRWGRNEQNTTPINGSCPDPLAPPSDDDTSLEA